MSNRDNERRFQTIVDTLCSTKDVNPDVIRAHVKEYAEAAGLPYGLAKQAVILKVQDILYKRIRELG